MSKKNVYTIKYLEVRVRCWDSHNTTIITLGSSGRVPPLLGTMTNQESKKSKNSNWFVVSVFLLRDNQFVKKLSQMKGLKPNSCIALDLSTGIPRLPLNITDCLGSHWPPSNHLIRILVQARDWNEGSAWESKLLSFKNSRLECWRFADAFWKFGYSTPSYAVNERYWCVADTYNVTFNSR